MYWNEIVALAYYIKGNADDIAELGKSNGPEFVRQKLQEIEKEILEMKMELIRGDDDEAL